MFINRKQKKGWSIHERKCSFLWHCSDISFLVKILCSNDLACQFIPLERRVKLWTLQNIFLLSGKYELRASRQTSPKPSHSSAQAKLYAYVAFRNYHRNSCVLSITQERLKKDPERGPSITPREVKEEPQSQPHRQIKGPQGHQVNPRVPPTRRRPRGDPGPRPRRFLSGRGGNGQGSPRLPHLLQVGQPVLHSCGPSAFPQLLSRSRQHPARPGPALPCPPRGRPSTGSAQPPSHPPPHLTAAATRTAHAPRRGAE